MSNYVNVCLLVSSVVYCIAAIWLIVGVCCFMIIVLTEWGELMRCVIWKTKDDLNEVGRRPPHCTFCEWFYVL
jgi:hypothetical protein